MNTKIISMSMRDDNGSTIHVTEHFDADCTWGAIAYQFYKFLAGMGYILESEAVGADVSDYCSALEVNEEDL